MCMYTLLIIMSSSAPCRIADLYYYFPLFIHMFLHAFPVHALQHIRLKKGHVLLRKITTFVP